jgi:hypothetical protein
MNAIIIAFVLLNTLAAAITCWYALCGLNACTRKTPALVRVSFAAIAVGTFGVILQPPEPDLGGAASVLILTGIAIGFIANRRQCVCLNCPARGKGRQPAPIDAPERTPSRSHHGGHPA